MPVTEQVDEEAEVMKFKLQIHSRQNCAADLVLNARDLPGAKYGNVVEIFPTDVDAPHLLLQISPPKDKIAIAKDVVSMEQEIAKTFNFKVFSEVTVLLVDPEEVALDSVEVVFRDQYFARSDMWKIKACLENTCIYLNKKVEFCGGTVRCSVYEMWSKGDRVGSGIVNKDTKIVFRSSTAMVYLFIQMSSEMWEFDHFGYLYFEKAVKGFLNELFQKWKKFGANHEVTIVLFSRTFYEEAKSLEEFPEDMRHCVRQDYKGRFYEDFYRVAIQKERYDDWGPTLLSLKKIFYEYPEKVEQCHARQGVAIPHGVNSTAEQGNFLEVLNISLNVFEKHYMDRSFERCGQISYVITPGVGYFEVDRDLCNITKQRIIDNGIGSDLICLGEQPLYAVPLFRYNNKLSCVDDFSIPHWINLSFYSMPHSKTGYNTFVPRVRVPPSVKARLREGKVHLPCSYQDLYGSKNPSSNTSMTVDDLGNTAFDYDAYDAQLFKVAPRGGANRRISTLADSGQGSGCRKNSASVNLTRQLSHPELYDPLASSDIPVAKVNSCAEHWHHRRCHHSGGSDGVGSAGATPAALIPAQAALIPASCPMPAGTPSSPSTMPIFIPNSRRPKGANQDGISTSFGALNLETQMKQRGASAEGASSLGKSAPDSKHQVQHQGPMFKETTMGMVGRRTSGVCSWSIRGRNSMGMYSGTDGQRRSRSLINPFDPSHIKTRITPNRKRWTHIFPKGQDGYLHQIHVHLPDSDSSLNGEGKRHSQRKEDLGDNKVSYVWEVTGQEAGQQVWSADMTTGVDWKSLTIPACLPITTDYFPDKQSLKNDFVISEYPISGSPEALFVPLDRRKYEHWKMLAVDQVFWEFIAQRLQQGFQMIVFEDDETPATALLPASSLANASAQTIVPLDRGSPSSSPTCHVPTNGTPENGEKKKRLPSDRPLLADEKGDEEKVVFLSIGRIFHRLSLNGELIKVKRFTPRHPYPQLNWHYKYRFLSPQADIFEVADTHFKTEQLDLYRWNYLDNYICFRGDKDYPLSEDLKYWRVNLLVLPVDKRNKSIGVGDRCDVYSWGTTAEELNSQSEKFLKFVEVVLNRLRRQSQDKQRSALYASGGRERPRLRSHGTKSGALNEGSLDGDSNSSSNSCGNGLNDSQGRDTGPAPLCANSPADELLDAMTHPEKGVRIIPLQFGLPPSTFVSADAIAWARQRVEGISTVAQAVELLQHLVRNKLICHASGDRKFPFLNGFFLYTFLWEHNGQPNDLDPLYTQDLPQFQQDWIEVEMIQPRSPPAGHAFLASEVTQDMFMWTPGVAYKHVDMEADINQKSDRIEWAHCKYQRHFRANFSYDLMPYWMTSTGPIIGELILNGWGRKAPNYNYHLVPRPFSFTGDPLRGTIFVPLDTKFLKGSTGFLFADYPPETWELRTFLFLESILRNFGFIPASLDSGDPERNNQPLYVHLSGNAFVRIPHAPTFLLEPRHHQGEDSTIDVRGDVESYWIAAKEFNERRLGFWWIWNHLISKRWRMHTGDDAFQRHLLDDFKAFCCDQENRLTTFWNNCLNKAQAVESTSSPEEQSGMVATAPDNVFE